jgi:hypothetical protein
MENNDDLTVELDRELYEHLAIWSMQCMQDDINEFVNNLLMFIAKREERRL